MIYTKHSGSNPYVVLPSQIGTDFITGIGAKTFLSHKEIHKLTLPSAIEHIDDWAFAHMHNLSELVLPANTIRFGKKVFLDCNNLRQIHVIPDTCGNPGLPYFLASAITVFSNINLLDPARAADRDSHVEWMQSYDKQMITYLLADDAAGFEPIFYGWFNDEDADSSQLPQYLSKQRENKTYLSFLRLQHDLHLAQTDREILQSYLRDHMPWGEKAADHTFVWDLLPRYYADDVRYCKILEDAGVLKPDTVPRLIEHLAEASAEVIAYLLRYQEKNSQFSDFFDNFSL